MVETSVVDEVFDALAVDVVVAELAFVVEVAAVFADPHEAATRERATPINDATTEFFKRENLQPVFIRGRNYDQ